MSPKEVAERGVASCFGMHEMEQAARRLVKELADHQYGWQGSVHVGMMQGDAEQTGFMELLQASIRTTERSLFLNQ
jgi:hypothetical protein